jgi:hypothetical protein
MSLGTFTQDPASKRNYTIPWSIYLEPGGKVASSIWEVPDGLTGTDEAIAQDKASTSITLTGGTKGNEYTVYNTATSENGYSERRAFIIRVVDAAEIREPTELEKQLSQVRVALGQKVTNDTQEYQIANRMKKRYSFEDLLAWEKRLTELVNAERKGTGGPGYFRNHLVRPVEPGP